MAYNPVAFDPIAYDVAQSALHVYTSDAAYWIPLKCVVEVYDNTGNTLLLSYDMFNPDMNPVKLLECTVSLGLTNTSFTLKFEDGNGVIDQNIIGLGNKILVYAGRSSDNLTLLFTGYSENRSPVIIADKVMDYEMSGYGENATLNDIIVNFKRASSVLTDIEDPNFPKRPDSKMVVHELVRDLFEDRDVRVTKDIVLKDYLNLDISGISPLVTERLLSIVQSMTEVSQVLNFLQEVTGAYWTIENGKLLFEYPEVKHSGIVIKNKVSNTDLADSTSYFTDQWRYTDSISKDNGFANRIYTTTSTDTKSVANAMTNQGATALFDRAIAVQVTLLETRVNTIALIMSKIGDPFTPLTDEEEISRGGPPSNPPPPPVTCPQGYHLVNGQCVPDVVNPPVCPTGYHWDTTIQQCLPDTGTPPTTQVSYQYESKFGSQGNGNGQFQDPHDISFASDGRCYVTDRIRNDIQIFTHTGTYITKFGTSGSGNGQFNVPYSCAHDANDNLYVADRDNNRVQKFDPSNNYVSQITTVNGQSLDSPEDVVFDHVNGDIYICDTGNNRIVKLSSNHTFIRQWGTFGDGDGQFNHPHSSDVGPDRNIYINSGNQPYIQKFSPDGVFIKRWGSAGTQDGQLLTFLEHMDIDLFGRLHIINNNARPIVSVFDLEGNFLTKYGKETEGSADGQFREPEHVTCDAAGKPYVVDAMNQRVQIFKIVTTTTPPTTPVCPAGYHYDATTQTCKPNATPPVCPAGYHYDNILQHCVLDSGTPPPTMDVQIMGFLGDTDGSAPQGLYQNMKSKGATRFGHMGDVSYSSNASTQLGYITNNLGFTKENMVCSIGNHDHPNESGSQGVLTAVSNYFGLPTSTYCQSRKWQNVYVIAMNTQDSNFDSTSSAQYSFVKAELEAATALKVQGSINWIIVLIHKPFYIGSGNNHPADEEGGRSIYQALFDTHQVDIVFHGHNHNIDIFKPLKSGGTVLATVTNNVYDFTKPHGQFYATIGSSGRSNYSVSNATNNIYTNDNDEAYCLLTFNNTGLVCQFQVFTASGSKLTEFTISKQGDTTTPPPVTPVCPSGYHWDTTALRCILDTAPPLGTVGGVNISAALNFIKNSYKSSTQMLEEAPGFNVFWLWNDQLLGQICLKHIDPTMANTIENKMNSFGVTMRTPWATLDPQYRNNFSIRTATEPTISSNPPIRYSDYNGNSEFSVTNYADIAFLSAIHHFYNGNLTLARQAYDAGRAFWNGEGMADAGNITGEYALYKIALGMLAEKITGFTPTIGIPADFFGEFQHANGGIITDKTGGSPSGSQNIETTAAVLFALRPSLLSPPSTPPPQSCPQGYHWDTTLQQCVQDNPPSGGEGEMDSYGIKWLVARGQQFVIDQSRDEAADDRWSGNVTGMRNGIEQTMIARSHGTNSSSHFASKLFGGNHSGSGASSQRWYDLGIRVNGDVQLQWEGPHPNNHDFNLPDTKWFIKNIGKGLENNWIGLKWCVQTIVTNGSPANGGVRCRMWVDTDPINTTTNRPNNNWRLCLDFIDGIDVEVIDPQSYQAPDEQDCEVRRSDTDSHDIYGIGSIITGSGEGDPGLHVRRMGVPAQTFADLPDYLQKSILKRKPLKVTDPKKNVGKPCKAFDCPRTTRRATAMRSKIDRENIVQVSEESGYSVDNKIVQSVSQLAEQVVHGEIRIDNENKPTGPVISQFKVEVGGLSSTADTIFVNDIKVDASVLSPTAKYWLVLLPCGTSYRNTVLWHHDNDMTTVDRYSAFAKGATRNDLSDWQRSRYGPTYCHAIFARLRRIQEYSDPQSIRTFRLKEDIAEADFLDDSLSVAKLMQNVLAIRGKPVRKYDLNDVTLPAGKWFTPGQNVTIVDDTGHHEESKNIFAEIQEVTYSWSTSAADSTIGTFRTKVLPVGHLNWHKELFPAGD